MIFRLEYCNKASVTARVDIQKGAATPVYTVEGTADPFTLFYNNDKNDKSGSFRSSGADINIYKTTEFNIDELKTSNETEISVKYYINNILNWSGFVIPDFFSETITGGQGVVSMVASDRLGTLKGATLSGLAETVKLSSLISQCLAKTGLSLSVNTKASFTSVAGGENVFESRVLSQRMIDMRGRRVSCYDILYSILVMTNSVVMQRHGEWWIANKIEWEAGGVLPAQQYHNFDDVSAGARLQIVPVASSVGVYHEFGGGMRYPSNHDFSIIEQTVPSVKFYEWTSFNSFVQAGNTLSVIGYSGETPIYGEPSIPMLKNTNESFNSFMNPDDQRYLRSNGIDIMSASSTSAQVNIEVSATGRNGSSFIVMVLADNGTNRYAMTKSGSFVAYDPVETQPVFLLFDTYDKAKGASDAVTRVSSYSGRLELENIDNYKIYIRIYGAGAGKTLFVNSASVTFAASVEIPSGNIYKTEQGDIYTKRHDTDTTIFGDYISGGLNGYFYNYMPDDVSSLMTSTGQPTALWTTPADGEPLPLLQHVTRQKSRMFSVAHDLLSADIKTSTFDPLSIFVDCNTNRYVVVSARFDFLRSNVSVELEEISYATNSKRDYIYSYFGEGEEGINSIAGIAGGYTPSTGVTIPPIPDPKLSELRAHLDIVDSDVATLTGTYNQIIESSVIGGAIKEGLTTLFTAVTDAAGAYKTYALTSLEDEVLTEEELAQLEILKQAYIDAVGAFKAVADPIITSLISVSLLKQNLQTYTSDKAQIDLVWSIISNNIYLVEPDKATYDNAKSAYDTAYTAIVNKINEVIADGMATPAELDEVGTLTTAYLTALANYRSAEEVARKAIIDEQKRQTQEYAETQWQDVIDTQEALEQSLLNFSESINPITAQMMQLIVGDESLQYIFVESKVNPVRVSHSVSYDTVEKKLTVYAGWIKHLTLGITDISPEHTYKFWQLPLYTSAALTDPDKSYYLYAKCSDTVETGEFVLSETPIAIDAVSGYYHLLVGILNAETNLTRRFAPLYGLTEVLPGRITLDKIVSVDGKMVIDLINNTITSPTLKISSGGGEKDIEELLDKLQNETLKAMEDDFISEAERRSLYAIYMRLDVEQEQLLSNVMYALNSIYMPEEHKDLVSEKANKLLKIGGSLDKYQEAITAILDQIDPQITEHKRNVYNKCLAIYKRDHDALTIALRDARLTVDAEIKRLSDEKTDTVEGGKNLIRNYDQRWDWDFWGGNGISVDIDLDAITIVNQRGLMDDGNLIEDESGNIIELV